MIYHWRREWRMSRIEKKNSIGLIAALVNEFQVKYRIDTIVKFRLHHD